MRVLAFLFLFLSFLTGHALSAPIKTNHSEAEQRKAETMVSSTSSDTGDKEAPVIKLIDHTIINSFNQQIIVYIDSLSKLLFQGTHALAHFPPVLCETIQQSSAPEYQEKLLDFALVLSFSIFFGYIAELIVRLLISKLMPKASTPITLARFSLNLALTFIPLLIFGFTASFIAHLLDKHQVLPHVIVIIGLLFITRLIMRYFKLLLQPSKPPLRVIPLSDRNARRFYRMVGLLTQILLWGTLCGQTFLILGMGADNYQIWQNITAFAALIVIAALIIDYRMVVADWLRPDDVEFENLPRIFLGLINVFARIWHILALGMLVILYMAWVYDEIERVVHLLQEVIATIVLIVAFRTLSIALRHASERIKRSFEEDADASHDPDEPWRTNWRKKSATPVTQSTFFLVPLGQVALYVCTFLIALEVWGLNLLSLLNNPHIQEYMLKGLSIALVVIVVKILWGLIDLLAKSHLQAIQQGKRKFEPSLFSKTIIPILRSTSKAVLAFLATLVILSELSIDIMPIIYAFSVISLAISFGAQTMVKDIITGFLYLFEGNIAVGETVKIGEHKGRVEAITLRSVFLRHNDGSIQSIPFSEVSYITNLSRDYTDHSITALVSHAMPIQDVYDALSRTFTEMLNHPIWGKEIKGDLKISGVDGFNDMAVTVSASVLTTPDPKGRFLKEFNAVLQKNMIQSRIIPPTQYQVVLPYEPRPA